MRTRIERLREMGDTQEAKRRAWVRLLRTKQLAGACLREKSFPWQDLKDAVLVNADMAFADVYRVDLRGADLRGANLGEANLFCADLRGADLRGAYLKGCNLWDANLLGSRINVGALDNALLDKEAWRVKDGIVGLAPGRTNPWRPYHG